MAATTSPKFASAWANIPSCEDHNSVGTDAQRSYEVLIQDPDNINDTINHSTLPNRKKGNTSAASSASQNPKNSGNYSRGRRPISAYNDHNSTVAGGSDHVWDTTLNTPRTEQSIQERLANTAISGTIELLKQVGGVTVSATGALVAPPLHITRTVLLPNLFAALTDYISSISPVRLKDWFRIFSSSIYHVFHTLQKTEAGHAFSNRMVVIMIDLIDCMSAETTRQLLVDGMSCFVKFFEIMHTPMFQSYCEQLTITGCRLIDAISNGRNKLLLFDLQRAVTSAGVLLADPATTVALAEVTAHLCYALEMEDQQIQIDDHKQSAVTQGNTTNGTTGSPRRHVRDTYQGEAVLKRDTLDTGHSVEKAILSSLGVENNHENDGHGGASIPASIILDTAEQKKSAIHDYSAGSNQSENPDISKALNWHERARNEVNVQVLQEGIVQRAHGLKESTHIQQTAPTMDNFNMGSNHIDYEEKDSLLDKTAIGGSLLDVEDQDVEVDDIALTGNMHRTCRAKQSIAFQSVTNDHEKEFYETSPEFGLNAIEPESYSRKEGEAANDHFYRILDEILGDARKKSADKLIADEMAQPSGMKAGISLNRRQTDPSNSTIKDRLNEIRSELKGNKNNATTTRKNVVSPLNRTDKKVLLVVMIFTLTVIGFWFLMGCYGLYIYFNPSAGLTLQQSVKSGSSDVTTTPHEIVIRVVKEIVYVNQDATELGREPWKQPVGTAGNEILPVDERIADCIASAYRDQRK